MSSTSLQAALIILVVAAVTFLTRVAPFLLFRSGNVPKPVVYLGNALPPAVMGMLIVYSLRNVSVTAYPHAIPEAIAICAVVLLHLWKHNNLLSILGGTVLYMFLVQSLFA